MSCKKRSKIRVAFGGKSVEHEISVITGLQALASIDPTEYDAQPLYISPTGSWHTGEALLDRSFYKNWQANLKQVDEVTPITGNHRKGLYYIKNEKIDLSSPIEIDTILMAFHGQYGEDGCIQGLFETCDIPYTSSPVPAAALAMNKYLTKKLLSEAGIEVLPCLLITREQIRREGLCYLYKKANTLFEEKGFKSGTLFIKPNNRGSSIGVGKATNELELSTAIAHAFRYDHEILIEPSLDNLLEINVSVLEDDSPISSVVEVPVASEKILSYEDKYLRGGKNKISSSSQGMAGLTRKIDPSDLGSDIKNQARAWARDSFILLGCAGVVRIDFMMDLVSGKLYFNELNTIPGSLSFYLWEKSKPRLLYPELLSHLIKRAQKRASENLCSERIIEFKALIK